MEPSTVYWPHGADDLEVRAGRLAVLPNEGRYRPSIDRFLASAAREYGDKVVAVLLSGAGTDGIAGLLEVRRHGGITVVQDPSTAMHAGLPQAALEHGVAEHVLTTAEILRYVDDALAGAPLA